LLEWFTGAEKEPVQTRSAHSGNTATILVSRDVRAALGDTYRHNYRVNLARALDAKFPDAGEPPLAIFSFVDNAVTMLNEWGITRGKEVAPATEYLWRFRKDAALEKRVREILSDTERRSYERMRKVRRVLGLPETTGDSR
ncbi:MAG: hypothetical protein LIP28_03220, partial [Deltaproteobacteria bacterium]|nr:hypothetical protein [Deltaproteobacteria bacterium]